MSGVHEIEQKEAELAHIREKRKALATPINQLKLASEQENSAHHQLLEVLAATNAAIDELLLHTLCSQPVEELTRRCRELGRLSKDAAFFQDCADGLKRTLCQRCTIQGELVGAKAGVQSAADQGAKALDQLGAAIAAGFHINSQQKHSKARVSGSVGFKEESSFFSFSGATGTVTGSGNGSATYTVEEVAWKDSKKLRREVSDFSQRWLDLGRAGAAQEVLTAQLNALTHTLAEYSQFIRDELEVDFREG